jgi:urea transport system substrate-binding protein
MSSVTDCPSPERIEDLLANRLSAAEAEALRRHLDSCPACSPRGRPTPVEERPAYPFLSPPQKPGELGRLEGHRITGVLGEGGMSIVFDAEDLNLHRPVALKVLRASANDPTTRERFLREARLLASLPHDHIVTVYHVAEGNGIPFLTMERLQGCSLADRLDRDRWLPVAEALALTREAAEGLAVAHEAGLVHRDIKPANLWLEERNGRFRRVKVIDFGIARQLNQDPGLTASGVVVGTPMYMAPEQARGWPVDGRTDLYSLGCVLFHMLTGRPPFDSRDTNTMALLQAVIAGDAPDLRREASRLPPRVAGLIHELLSADPDKRPASARALIERLRQLEDEPTAAFTPPPMPRPAAASGRLMRRPGVLGIWLGVLAIAAALLVGAYEAYQRLAADRPTDPDEGESAGGGVVPGGPPWKVGVVHSLSGTLSIHELPMLKATELAVEEINAKGGVLGRPIRLLEEDGESNPEVFADKARKLIEKDKVAVVFGCWTSSARKRVAEVCREHDRLLFYSVSWEGLEASPNVVYLGGTPNQTLIPMARWAYAEKGKRRFFLIGSDGVFSHAVNAILELEIKRLGAEVVGERYATYGETNFDAAVEEMKKAKADLVVNTIDGQSNVALFRAMRNAGLRPPAVTTVWNSISEPELSAFRTAGMVGDCSVGCYFESLGLPENRAFVERFRARFGARERVNDPMETAYFGVYLWKKAVERASTASTGSLRRVLRGLSVEAPEGVVSLDEKQLYAWRTARVGEVVEGEKFPEFEVVYSSPGPRAPLPFPEGRSEKQWKTFLDGLYKQWGGHWEKER